ncbi:MAG: hypothetical protein ACRDM1_11770 [Gaiellaceae bacterium]
MARGPLAVAWGAPPALEPHAGTVETVRVEVANDGSLAWAADVHISSHWLDLRGNPIVWDGPRSDLPPLAPGGRTTVEVAVRAPIPPGRYRLALDLVAEHRAWFSELGSPMLAQEVDVLPRDGEPNAHLPPGLEPAPGWAERVRAAHAEGYGVVAGAIEWTGGLRRRRPRELEPYAPGQGRVPGFAAPLVCPSVLPGIELEPLADVAGLPAFAAPGDEPWIFDGRAVLRTG